MADMLSWLPLPSSGFALPEVSRDITLHRITGEGLTLTEIQTVTAADDVLSRVVKFVQTQWPPKGQITADLLPYYHIYDEFHLEQGCLVRDCQFVPPVSLHTQIFGLAHSGHPGITCMRWIVRETYWWPGLSMQIHELVSQCSGCQMSEKTTPPAMVPDIQVHPLIAGLRSVWTSQVHSQMPQDTRSSLLLLLITHLTSQSVC